MKTKSPTLTGIRSTLHTYATPARAAVSARFFRTGKGEYGEGDVFIGVTVPDTRSVAKEFSHADRELIHTLLHSRIHEERLLSLLILVDQFQKGDAITRKSIFDFYMKNAQDVNNWDLVDLSADKIVGTHLVNGGRALLDQLARSPSLWKRRIAIVSTFAFIRAHEFEDTFRIVDILMNDSHDLIHKACGWMLREVGKRDERALVRFLDRHAQRMPRTMLRYSIERFPENVRKHYLATKK